MDPSHDSHIMLSNIHNEALVAGKVDVAFTLSFFSTQLLVRIMGP